MTNSIIARYFNLSTKEISPEMHLIYDCMADSLILIDLFIELESYYHIKFTSNNIENIETVDDIYKFLRSI
ncbi:Acyl carrier protein [Arsenophonus endosymbiont of Aleurodicus floccissimus]|uniref:acyl carrier protein n=1 Tax=Arsenophonus endosymbiont of Aleurodicus floccissimus TaxID=2152761 RepID=UPI000E6AEC9C|nr:Acyl carrier protein [Arsenophonus endosymbiont of Aleurodicus floccissimus]